MGCPFAHQHYRYCGRNYSFLPRFSEKGLSLTFAGWSPASLRFPTPSDRNQRGGEPSSTRCLLDGKCWLPDNLPELGLSPTKHSHAPCLSRKQDSRRRKCVDHAVQPSRSRRSWQNFPTKHGSRPSRLRSHQSGALRKRLDCVTTHPPSVSNRH